MTTDHRDRYPHPLPDRLRQIEAAHHTRQEQHKAKPLGPLAPSVGSRTPDRTPRARLHQALVVAYVALSLATCIALLTPDDRSSGGVITPGQGAALTFLSQDGGLTR